MRRNRKTVRLGQIGSMIFGFVLFAAGWWADDFVESSNALAGEGAAVLGKITTGMMILGAIIGIGNVIWLSFLLIVLLGSLWKSRAGK